MSRFFEVIKKDVETSILSDLPEFLSTHPDLDARIAATRQPATGAPAMSDADWQLMRKVCDSK
jgi:hypothetical protein